MANIVETIKANPLILVGVAGGGLVLYLVLKNKGTTPNSGQPLYYPSGGSQPGTYSPSYISPLPSPVPPVPPGPPWPHPKPGNCGDVVCAPGSHCEGGHCVLDGEPMPMPIPDPHPGPLPRPCAPGYHRDPDTGSCVSNGGDTPTEAVFAGMADGGPMGSIFAFGGKGGGRPSAATEAVPYREVYNTVTALHSMRRT